MAQTFTREYGAPLGDGYCCSDAERKAIVDFVLNDTKVRSKLLSMSPAEWWDEEFSFAVTQLVDLYAVKNKLRVCMLDVVGDGGVTDMLRQWTKEAQEAGYRHR